MPSSTASATGRVSSLKADLLLSSFSCETDAPSATDTDSRFSDGLNTFSDPPATAEFNCSSSASVDTRMSTSPEVSLMTIASRLRTCAAVNLIDDATDTLTTLSISALDASTVPLMTLRSVKPSMTLPEANVITSFSSIKSKVSAPEPVALRLMSYELLEASAIS